LTALLCHLRWSVASGMMTRHTYSKKKGGRGPVARTPPVPFIRLRAVNLWWGDLQPLPARRSLDNPASRPALAGWRGMPLDDRLPASTGGLVGGRRAGRPGSFVGGSAPRWARRCQLRRCGRAGWLRAAAAELPRRGAADRRAADCRPQTAELRALCFLFAPRSLRPRRPFSRHPRLSASQRFRKYVHPNSRIHPAPCRPCSLQPCSPAP
jgi:hypothetical protein